MKILQVSAHYYPNVGGVETHLSDLVKALVELGDDVFVLTYRPLTTNVEWKIFEHQNRKKILRIPYFSGLFYSLVKMPLLEFLYLFPGLFLVLPFILLYYDPEVIHSHGLVAGTVAAFWGKVFEKKVIISIHSVYHFPETGLYRSFVKEVFERVDKIICLSRQSAREVESLGIKKNKIGVFTYWVDLKKFKQVTKAKEELGWKGKFIVFFVGRLIPEKGIIELLDAAKIWNKEITLVIAGGGPLESYIKDQENKIKNLIFLGQIDNNQLPVYYSAADLLIVPSVHEEGFGRVILESLACGTPVIGSNRGAIPEAMDESVGVLIKVTAENILQTVEDLAKNKKKLNPLKANTRQFAEERYAEKNVEGIINFYDKRN